MLFRPSLLFFHNKYHDMFRWSSILIHHVRATPHSEILRTQNNHKQARPWPKSHAFKTREDHTHRPLRYRLFQRRRARTETRTENQTARQRDQLRAPIASLELTVAKARSTQEETGEIAGIRSRNSPDKVQRRPATTVGSMGRRDPRPDPEKTGLAWYLRYGRGSCFWVR